MSNINPNADRHTELSTKLNEMGVALIKEGRKNNDYQIAQTGTSLKLISEVIMNPDDVFLFGQLCSMFSAKKLIDDMEAKNAPNGSFGNNVVSYEDFMNYLKSLRGGNGDTPKEQ